jgi:hypothetical protein
MKRLLRHRRLALLVTLLPLSGLALAAGSTPAAHAAPFPGISANGAVYHLAVTGSHFTPKGTVLVEVRRFKQASKTWYLEDASYVKALGPHYVCHTSPWGTVICGFTLGGQISATEASLPGPIRVVAYDFGSGIWSNVAATYVFP